MLLPEVRLVKTIAVTVGSTIFRHTSKSPRQDTTVLDSHYVVANAGDAQFVPDRRFGTGNYRDARRQQTI